MKKNIMLVSLGFILAICCVAIAEGLNARDVEYNNTTVEGALDALYQRSNHTEYSGSTMVTPSTTEQILSTNNKLLKSDITIGAIPSNYKELNGTANISADKILAGYTAFNENGELITGNLSTDCAYGIYNHAQNTQIDINVGFTPTYILYYFTNSRDTYYVVYDGTNFYQDRISQGDFVQISTVSAVSYGIKSNEPTTSTKYTDAYTIKYMACK